MAYDRHRDLTVYVLRFEQYDGLVVRVRKPSFAGLRALARYTLALGGNPSGERLLRAWDHLFAAFADALVSWDLDNSGQRVPATRRGVMSQDPAFLHDLATTWYSRVVMASSTPAAAPVDDEPGADAGPDWDHEFDLPMATLTAQPEAEPELAQAG